MQDLTLQNNTAWPLWRKCIFRFFFIYFILFISPWFYLNIIPGVHFILDYLDNLMEWAVINMNANIFHVFHIVNVKPVQNGSGDTSFNWAEICLFLFVAFLGCILWSVLDRSRRTYSSLNYLLCLTLRYFLALNALGYGFSKILLLQMPSPLLSQMATPLGDFLPMRFSWLFIGYSAPYEIFSGIMEVLVGILLLYRKTATMGIMIATAVFINVMMLNLCYDIPVKLFSMNMVLMCLFLLANECRRMTNFFVHNKTSEACRIYHYPLQKRWMRITRIILKVMVLYIIAKGFYGQFSNYKMMYKTNDVQGIQTGIYDVVKYIVNKDSITSLQDTSRWKDIIFEHGEIGSVDTKDTSFRNRYGRGYFFYTADTNKHTITFKKFLQDSMSIITMNYSQPDSSTMHLEGKRRNDSIYVEVKRSTRHFQLAEHQFHWLSEANR